MAAKTTRKKTKKSKGNGSEELRLTPLEQAELNLCERDWELSVKDIELSNAKIQNLTMDYHQKSTKLKDMLLTAQRKSEQLALIRNRKLSEIESRLRSVDEKFSFRNYLEQDDGLLVPNEDLIPELDPTAGGGSDTTVTA